MLLAGVLRVIAPVAWADVRTRLRPFVAARIDAADVDDVLQDVLVRMHRGLGGLADADRFDAWLYQIARSAIADAGRARARHPLPRTADAGPVEAPADDGIDEVADPARLLAACMAPFVARLPSPYREAVTLVELEGLTARAAAELAGISTSGMKSRVQRGRALLRTALEACCHIAVDARGQVVEVTPRPRCHPATC